MNNKVKAIVKGQYQHPGMKEPKRFEEEVTFTIYPPKPGEPHYGNGCYMGVESDNGIDDLIDVRYMGNRHIKELAKVYIENHWGSNLREYTFA